MQLVTYLGFKGQCEEAFKFYEKCLGGKIVAMFTFAEMPSDGNAHAEFQNQIMHARLAVGDAVLMGSDTPAEYFKQPQGMHVSLHVEEPAEAERIFHDLAEGGHVSMPIEETFWALRFGIVTDRFGTPWMINCEKPA